MSYTIEYNRQFIRTKNGYIPCWLAGDNNSTTGWGRYERRSRDWGIFHNWLDVSEEYMLKEVKKYFNDYNQHWKRNNEFLTNDGLLRWVKNGCKSAATIEDIIELNHLYKGVKCYVSYWDAEGNHADTLSLYVNTSAELDGWVERVKQFTKQGYNEGIKSIYPIIDFVKEDLKHPKTQIDREYGDDEKFILKYKNRYLNEIGVNTSNWVPDIKQAKVLTYREVCELREPDANGYINSIFTQARMVPAEKVNAKRFVLRFADGMYKGQYIGRASSRRVSLSSYQTGAKVFTSKSAAEKSIDTQYSALKKYGTLIVEEY